jgi:hypothetical protein
MGKFRPRCQSMLASAKSLGIADCEGVPKRTQCDLGVPDWPCALPSASASIPRLPRKADTYTSSNFAANPARTLRRFRASSSFDLN